MNDDSKRQQSGKRPAIEWIAGGTGLLITIGLLVFIGWEALQDPRAKPVIETRVTSVAPAGDNFLVEVTAFNRASVTVAGLSVEGTLKIPGQAPEHSNTTFDYVPGHSQARGGLFFASDPKQGVLQVRATGYQRP